MQVLAVGVRGVNFTFCKFSGSHSCQKHLPYPLRQCQRSTDPAKGGQVVCWVQFHPGQLCHTAALFLLEGMEGLRCRHSFFSASPDFVKL